MSRYQLDAVVHTICSSPLTTDHGTNRVSTKTSIHIMPLGGHEEAVKAAQPDWSKPLPSNLFGVFKAEAFEHNTWWNSYVYDGYDQRDAPERHFEQDFQWG